MASLDEVWADANSYGRRASPGLSSSSFKKASKKAAAAGVAPSCAKTDPLCDLYNRGYSSAFDDIMDTYSSGDMYDKTPYSRTQAAIDPAADTRHREPQVVPPGTISGGDFPTGFDYPGGGGQAHRLGHPPSPPPPPPLLLLLIPSPRS